MWSAYMLERVGLSFEMGHVPRGQTDQLQILLSLALGLRIMEEIAIQFDQLEPRKGSSVVVHHSWGWQVGSTQH